MHFSSGSGRRALPALTAAGFALALSACSVFTGGSEPQVAAASAQGAPAADQIDVGRYLGSGYCPELRIRPGTEVVRQYERGYEEDSAHVIWQASLGDTARECRYDQAGNLTLRVGVSGRLIAGPKGGGQTATLPLRIAVVKHKEAVLANELYRLSIAVPPAAPVVFSEVREVTVPSPGDSRDYIIYVGYDEKGENLLDPGAALVAAAPPPTEPREELFEEEIVEEEAVEAEEPPPPPPPPAEPAGPRMLPTPTDGFVLPRG